MLLYRRDRFGTIDLRVIADRRGDLAVVTHDPYLRPSPGQTSGAAAQSAQDHQS